MNSPISWVGGKKSLRDMIYQRLPKDFGRYIEVFGGGGWVLFGRKPSSVMEVYNDFNSDLANMFRCIRDRPMALLKELGFLPLNGRDEFNVLKKFLEKEEFTNEYLQEEIEIAQRYFSAPQYDEIKLILLENAQMNDVKRAAAFYKLIRLSYGSGCTSYGCQPFDIRKTFDLIWQARLSGLQGRRSTRRSRPCRASSQPRSPGLMLFWIPNWSKSCALTRQSTRKGSARGKAPSSLLCRRKITQNILSSA